MDLNDTALIAAGCIGAAVAVFHGIILQRYFIAPLVKLAGRDDILAGARGRLFPLLMHFSTLAWFVGGIALILAPFWFDSAARLAAVITVGALYLVGALGNAVATRGRHPGWILLALAVALIWYGA